MRSTTSVRDPAPYKERIEVNPDTMSHIDELYRIVKAFPGNAESPSFP